MTSSFPRCAPGCYPQPHGATFTYRAWLLHMLHIHLVRWRGIQPPYCFHGATATRWPRSASLGLTIGQRFEGVPRSAILCLHMGIRSCDPHTHELLLPSFPSLLAPGCREAISVFTNPPFLLVRLPFGVFSGGVGYSPRQGSETTTRPCLRAPMGERLIDALRLSLLGWSPILTGHVIEFPRSTHRWGFRGD